MARPSNARVVAGGGVREPGAEPDAELPVGAISGRPGRTFTLKLRIVTPELAPFKRHDVEIEWGDQTLWGELDDDGFVKVQDAKGNLDTPVLNGAYSTGVLRIGQREKVDERFVFVTKIFFQIQRQTNSEIDFVRRDLEELGYRLANLGLLPMADAQVARWQSAKMDWFREAAARYAFRHGFRTLDPRESRTPTSDRCGEEQVVSTGPDGQRFVNPELLEHVKRTHDGG